eukprot:gnl/TRDRNA2_/TRDRNA2_82489_c0_seq1.p1 gnl/TRDRNA2_/TRDRNA2_82489_c0~~gnl/TRDRNA2_/TRDRNA2_82489_c0_seq1.p1  ORF type:complete len:228 (-),score=48.17 gnl/TRDRNA2_/TRDRNA2_82489_c0_seq1:118-744(-)
MADGVATAEGFSLPREPPLPPGAEHFSKAEEDKEILEAVQKRWLIAAAFVRDIRISLACAAALLGTFDAIWFTVHMTGDPQAMTDVPLYIAYTAVATVLLLSETGKMSISIFNRIPFEARNLISMLVSLALGICAYSRVYLFDERIRHITRPNVDTVFAVDYCWMLLVYCSVLVFIASLAVGFLTDFDAAQDEEVEAEAKAAQEKKAK